MSKDSTPKQTAAIGTKRYRLRRIKKPGGSHRALWIAADAATQEAHAKALLQFGEALSAAAGSVAAALPAAHGCVPGRSPTTGALVHAGQRWVLTADLRSFFDRVTRKQVQAGLRHIGARGAAHAAEIATPRGFVRQGLSTSPMAANIAAAPLDAAILAALETISGARYTRYVDDLAVSFSRREDASAVTELLRLAVAQFEGWEIHPDKWKLQDALRGRVVICGVALDDAGKPHATREARRRLRAAKHRTQTAASLAQREAAHRSATGLAGWCAQRLPVATQVDARLQGMRSADARQHIGTVLRDLRGRAAVVRGARRRIAEAWPQIGRMVWTAHQEVCARVAGGGYRDAETWRWALALVLVFGAEWRAWLSQAQQREVHDLCDWLPVDPRASTLGVRLLGWQRAGVDTRARRADLRAVAAAWVGLPHVAQVEAPLAELVELVEAVSYGPTRHSAFARYAAREGLTPAAFRRTLRRWLRAQPAVERIPRVTVTQDGLQVQVIDRADPRGLWAGTLTECCQHPEGAGETSAWHSVTDARGGVLLVTDAAGVVVAQSWIWRGTGDRARDMLVLDSLEAPAAADRQHDAIARAVTVWAQTVLGRLCVREVRVGDGPIEASDYWPRAKWVASPPEDCYTDANDQWIVATLVAEGEEHGK